MRTAIYVASLALSSAVLGIVTPIHASEWITITLIKAAGERITMQVVDTQATINLSGQGLSIIQGFDQMANLHNFDASNNVLSSIPPGITSQSQLQTLDVTGNKLTALPTFDGNLKLKVLAAGNNQITTLDGFVNLPKLRYIDLSENALSPEALQALDGLDPGTVVDLTGNSSLNCELINQYLAASPGITIIFGEDC